MPFLSIPSADFCLQQTINENVNGRAIFEIVVVERRASFYRIHDRKNVRASNISKNRPGF